MNVGYSTLVKTRMVSQTITNWSGPRNPICADVNKTKLCRQQKTIRLCTDCTVLNMDPVPHHESKAKVKVCIFAHEEIVAIIAVISRSDIAKSQSLSSSNIALASSAVNIRCQPAAISANSSVSNFVKCFAQNLSIRSHTSFTHNSQQIDRRFC